MWVLGDTIGQTRTRKDALEKTRLALELEGFIQMSEEKKIEHHIADGVVWVLVTGGTLLGSTVFEGMSPPIAFGVSVGLAAVAYASIGFWFKKVFLASVRPHEVVGLGYSDQLARRSRVLGFCSLFLTIFPIISVILAILGVRAGFTGAKSSLRGAALAGLWLSWTVLFFDLTLFLIFFEVNVKGRSSLFS